MDTLWTMVRLRRSTYESVRGAGKTPQRVCEEWLLGQANPSINDSAITENKNDRVIVTRTNKNDSASVKKKRTRIDAVATKEAKISLPVSEGKLGEEDEEGKAVKSVISSLPSLYR